MGREKDSVGWVWIEENKGEEGYEVEYRDG